jgi:hypothetical protein
MLLQHENSLRLIALRLAALALFSVSLESHADRFARGFMPYLNVQSSFGGVNSSVSDQSNTLGLLNFGAGFGAAWYFNDVLLEGSVGFKFERVQGVEDGLKANLMLNSYSLNVAANYRLQANRNWSFGPLIQTQVSNGTIRYSRHAEEAVGQVYWAGAGINYDITNLFESSHLRVGLNAVRSMFLPNQTAYFGAVVVGFAFGGDREVQVVQKVIHKEVLPEYLRGGTFVWMKTDDPNWDQERYLEAQSMLGARRKLSLRPSKSPLRLTTISRAKPTLAASVSSAKKEIAKKVDRKIAAVMSPKVSAVQSQLSVTSTTLQTKKPPETQAKRQSGDGPRRTAAFETIEEALSRLESEAPVKQ